jgi:hypothetical protein
MHTAWISCLGNTASQRQGQQTPSVARRGSAISRSPLTGFPKRAQRSFIHFFVARSRTHRCSRAFALLELPNCTRAAMSLPLQLFRHDPLAFRPPRLAPQLPGMAFSQLPLAFSPRIPCSPSNRSTRIHAVTSRPQIPVAAALDQLRLVAAAEKAPEHQAVGLHLSRLITWYIAPGYWMRS